MRRGDGAAETAGADGGEIVDTGTDCPAGDGESEAAGPVAAVGIGLDP